MPKLRELEQDTEQTGTEVESPIGPADPTGTAEIEGELDPDMEEVEEPEEEEVPSDDPPYLVSEDFVRDQFPDASSEKIWKLMTRATDIVAEYLRTSFSEKLYEEEVLDLKSRVPTKHLPINSVELVENITSDEPTELTEGEDYLVYPTHILFLGQPTFTRRAVKVTYKAGLTSCPTDFSLVAEDLIRFWAFKEDKRDELFYKKEDMEDRSYEMRVVSENNLLSRLAKYRYSPDGTIGKGNVRIGVI